MTSVYTLKDTRDYVNQSEVALFSTCTTGSASFVEEEAEIMVKSPDAKEDRGDVG